MTENETYLSHLKAQLADLRSAKARYEEMEDQINEMEQHYLMLRQERTENEAHLEESIKTHTKILEGVKTENNFMVKNLMDKQVLTENSFQLLNAKKQELSQTRADVAAAESKLDSLNRMCGQVEDKITLCKNKLTQVTAEKVQHQVLASEIKENVRILSEQVTEHKLNAIEREKECMLAEKKRESQGAILEEKRAELRQLQAQVEGSKAEVESVQDQIEQKNRQIRDMKQISSQMAIEAKDLTGKLASEVESNRDLEEKIDTLKAEIERLAVKKVEVEEQCKEKARRIDDLTEAVDALQNKRGQLHKQAAYLQDKTAEFAKLGQKAKVSLRGTDLLRKEETLGEMMAGYEALTIVKN